MNIGIIGCGLTGYLSAINAKRLGFEVYLSELKDINMISAEWVKNLKNKNIHLECGKNTYEFFKNCDTIILSPGIPENTLIKQLKKSKTIISDIDFAYQYMKEATWIGITGTNGKTTTTALLGKMIEKKYKTFIGGNIGDSPTNAINKIFEYFVIEISSFQLDISQLVRFKHSIITNIAEDHLNRYKTMENYIHSKLKIISLTDEKTFINGDDNILIQYSKDKYIIPFSIDNKNSLIHYNEINNTIILDGYTIHLDGMKLNGIHNIYNIMAASLVAYYNNIPIKTIEQTIISFEPPPYRLQLISTINGIKIYNDSKSTTPHSTLYALKSFKGNKVFLLLGGSDEKQSDFTILNPIIKQLSPVIYVFGKGADYIIKQLKSHNVFGPTNIETALKNSINHAKNGDIILFSPGTPSFDRFENYKERGKFFNELVKMYEKKV